ncbi:hypothetical protein PYCC9005_005884 [Savitreella phatthalungensis]
MKAHRPQGERSHSHFLGAAGAQIDEIRSRLSRRPQATESAPLLDYSITIAEDALPNSAADDKLDTLLGVFMPTTLNVLSILMFLRFSFIVGQAGFVGTTGMLLASYALNLLTVLSVSAISTNGTVRGGGAYYMISRCLGPEFGGSIGIVFYLGQVLNAGLNVVGFIEPLLYNYGRTEGELARVLPDSPSWLMLYGTLLCILCTCACTAGSRFFARISLIIFFFLGVSVLSIPTSAAIVPPFRTDSVSWGLSVDTLKGNLFPQFTRGAAGSQIKGKESLRSVFGLLFPATAGIFAGSADSGKLRNPSKSIPRGTLYGLMLTFVLYTAVIIVIAFGVPRNFLYTNLNVLQDINLHRSLILGGALSTATFSALCGINGAAKMLQAIARDDSLPILRVFKYGTQSSDEPLVAVAATYVLTQLVLFADINAIASLVTMTFLLTFAGINLACCLLDLSSAPNFRPSFTYYSWSTALAGFLGSFATMFFVDGVYAAVAFTFFGALFLLVHYFGAPRNYGDISQALIYHQVRKFLLRLDKGRSRDHVKFWRPQVLLLVNDARRNVKLIRFCNALKKSGLYVLGHVLVTKDFGEDLEELRRQQDAWHKLVEHLKVKAFVQVGVAQDEVWGAMNLCLSSGLGGLKPNLVVIAFFNLAGTDPGDLPAMQRLTEHAERRQERLREQADQDKLPTDNCRRNPAMAVCTYLNIVEDIIASFNLNIAIAKGFGKLEDLEQPQKRYLDLWPIQMSPTRDPHATDGLNILSTNFDTYTMILQMGQILHTSNAWKSAYTLRVLVFVEHSKDISEERRRVSCLLENLRINATLVVLSMDDGHCDAYEMLVGRREWSEELRAELRDEQVERAYTSRRSSTSSRAVSVSRRKLSMHEEDLSRPLSFKLHVPMPPWSGTSTDTEDDDDDDALHYESGDLQADLLPPSTTVEHAAAPLDIPSQPGATTITFAPAPTDAREYRATQAPSPTFDDLSCKAQHLIINSLIRAQSGETAVVFTTLPPPDRGTHRDEHASRRYLENLAALTDGLPPTILIHSKSLTVTTAL